jgi:hypothetical protein
MVITLFVFEIISQKSKGSRIERKKGQVLLQPANRGFEPWVTLCQMFTHSVPACLLSISIGSRCSLLKILGKALPPLPARHVCSPFSPSVRCQLLTVRDAPPDNAQKTGEKMTKRERSDWGC